MGKKEYGKNIYWGDELAPVECQYRIVCNTLDRAGFRMFMKDVKSEGLYYYHKWEERLIVLAFKDKAMRDMHAELLELQARMDKNYKVKIKK